MGIERAEKHVGYQKHYNYHSIVARHSQLALAVLPVNVNILQKSLLVRFGICKWYNITEVFCKMGQLQVTQYLS